MLDVEIPGFGRLTLAHLVLDYNGTLAVGGQLIEGVFDRLQQLSQSLQVHVVTADTFGQARQQLEGVSCQLTVLGGQDQDIAKEQYISNLQPSAVVAIGNGRNDRRMLKRAALGIAVVGPEGMAVEAMRSARIVVPDICSALDLLLQPKRLIATLRT